MNQKHIFFQENDSGSYLNEAIHPDVKFLDYHEQCNYSTSLYSVMDPPASVPNETSTNFGAHLKVLRDSS